MVKQQTEREHKVLILESEITYGNEMRCSESPGQLILATPRRVHMLRINLFPPDECVQSPTSAAIFLYIRRESHANKERETEFPTLRIFLTNYNHQRMLRAQKMNLGKGSFFGMVRQLYTKKKKEKRDHPCVNLGG